MAEYTNCYIAFLDILGFKNIIQNRVPYLSSCDEIYKLYTDHIMFQPENKFLGNENISIVKRKVMSDSVCFFVDCREENSLEALIKMCILFQVLLLRLPTPVLVRGAIARGDIFSDGDILFGPGLVTAYLMEENNAKKPRIILPGGVLEYAKRNSDKNVNSFIKNVIFCDDDKFFVLDYFDAFIEMFGKGEGIWNNAYQRVIAQIDDVINNSLDSSIREKYLYLDRHLRKK